MNNTIKIAKSIIKNCYWNNTGLTPEIIQKNIQERILIKDEEIYNNFLKEYSILFRNTFVGFTNTNTNRM